MSVRKRTWTSKGEVKEAWIVDYTDQAGDRHIETFAKKKDADARHDEVRQGVRRGTHVAASKSITVAEAAKNWISAGEGHGLERATLKTYGEHVDQHIVPFIGRMKLSELNAPAVRKFEETLRKQGRSTAMRSKILVSLGSLIADAQEHGLAAHNAVRDLRRNRKRGKDRQAELRRRGKLKIGVDIPTLEEISAILAQSPGRWRPFLVTAVFTGLRASELRGLRWADVDLKANELHVSQRADRYNDIGRPKSAAGERTVPFGPIVANALKEQKLVSKKTDLNLVFCTASGLPLEHSNALKASLLAAQVKAGILVDGKPKYTGLHVLRHFYASWCIDRKLAPKVVQERLGHSSITMTYDRYGHLFPRGDDAEEIDAAERAVVDATRMQHRA
jgi:integrase